MCISSISSEEDELVITFNDQRLFLSETDKMVHPQTVIKSKIKRQIAGADQELVESLTSATAAAVTTTGIVSVIFGFVLKGAMRRLLKVVKSLQVILHMLLIQVMLVAHTDNFIGSLQGIVFANMYDRDYISKMADYQTEQQER